MNLDERLMIIAEALYHRGHFNARWNVEITPDKTKFYVEEMKQAFKEADYYPLMPDEMLAVANYNDGKLMTGQEWLARFLKEAESEYTHFDDPSECPTCEHILAAAKRASGASE